MSADVMSMVNQKLLSSSFLPLKLTCLIGFLLMLFPKLHASQPGAFDETMHRSKRQAFPSSTNSLGALDALPRELHMDILSYLNPLELASIAIASKGFQEIAENESLWKPHWNSIQQTGIIAPLFFRHLSLKEKVKWCMTSKTLCFLTNLTKRVLYPTFVGSLPSKAIFPPTPLECVDSFFPVAPQQKVAFKTFNLYTPYFWQNDENYDQPTISFMQDLQEWESLSLYISIDADNFILAFNEEDVPATISMAGPPLDLRLLEHKHHYVRANTVAR